MMCDNSLQADLVGDDVASRPEFSLTSASSHDSIDCVETQAYEYEMLEALSQDCQTMAKRNEELQVQIVELKRQIATAKLTQTQPEGASIENIIIVNGIKINWYDQYMYDWY
jgi:hypothetical protein